MATITCTICEEVYPAPVYGEDYCPDGDDIDRDSWEEEFTFRELMRELERYAHPSEWPLRDPSPRVWVSTEAESDFHTGEHTIRSIHFSSDNAPRLAKYWRKALLTAYKGKA